MPAYKHAPIQEAVCEFTFSPLRGNPEWDLTLPGRLQVDPALAEYSGASRQQHLQTIATGVNKGQPEFAVQNQLFRIHLPTKDDKALLSLGHNVLGIVVLRPYEGWKAFLPRIVRALQVFTMKTGQTVVDRIGVRYINRIVTPAPDASSASKFLTGIRTQLNAIEEDKKTKVEGSLTALNARHEFVTRDGIKVFVTHATLDPQKPKTAEYVLDIDTVWDHKPLDGLQAIRPVIEKLHAVEGAVFESLITQEARDLFNA